MGKFALRDLAQSLARELSPQSIHVTHFVIDGRIRGAKRTEPADKLDSMLDPDAIAANYRNVCGNRAALWLGKWDCGLGPKLSSWTQLFSTGLV
jgi:hypothetical protein